MSRIKIICASIAAGLILATSAAAMIATDVNYRDISLHTRSTAHINAAGATSLVTAGTPPLSPAIDSIRSNHVLRKWALAGNDITFRPEEFEEILGIRRIRYITITELPDMREGVLTLSGNDITAGQTIPRENIKHLRLVPYPGRLGSVSFYFKDGERSGGSPILCSVNILQTLNFPPTAYSVDVVTQQNISVFSAMKATDPDGDAIDFIIIRAPQHGLLELRGNGSFVYRPRSNFTGRDRFVYKAQDEHGNRSAPATVNIRVTRAASTVRFTDMDDHWAANAAIRGVGAGFIDINPDFRFNPYRLMTRAEFVYMAVRAAGLDRNLPEIIQTSFEDDDDIPGRFKAHVTQAYDFGIINGVEVETGVYFDPNNIITRAEAAVILNNILQIPMLSAAIRPGFADAPHIPYWAAQHVAALDMHGIINGDQNGNFNPYGLLNRAQSAEMLCNMIDYTNSVRSSARWWSLPVMWFGGNK